RLHPRAWGHAGGLVDRLVVGGHGLLLVLREAVPLRRSRQRRVAVVDQQHVLHRILLSWSVVASETNEGRGKGHSRRTARAGSPRPSLRGSLLAIAGCGARCPRAGRAVD